jgi:hypothetical protein
MANVSQLSGKAVLRRVVIPHSPLLKYLKDLRQCYGRDKHPFSLALMSRWNEKQASGGTQS